MNKLNWKLYRKINSIRAWSSCKVEFLSEITSFLLLKFEYVNYLFPIQRFSYTFYDHAEYCFFFVLFFLAEIMRGSCVFYCSSCLSFNATSHLNGPDKSLSKNILSFIVYWIHFGTIIMQLCFYIVKLTHLIYPYLVWFITWLIQKCLKCTGDCNIFFVFQ